MRFRYVARNTSAQTVTGIIEAKNEQEAIKNLRSRRLHVVSIQPEQQTKGKRQKVKGSVLANFTKEMSVMLSVSIGQDEALTACANQAPPGFAQTLREVRNAVSSGIKLSDALASHPHVFDSVYVNMVRAGEENGNLSATMQELAGFIVRQNRIRSKVVSALIYPAIILSMTFASAIFLILVVFPRLQDLYDSLGGELPAITQFFIGVGNFVRFYWYYVLPALAAGVYFALRWLKTPNGKRFKDSIFIKIPIVGPFIKITYMVRFAKTLASLMAAGVRTPEALRIAGRTAGNYLIEEATEDVIQGVRQGEQMSSRMRKYDHLFPVLLINMIQTGERSSRIPEMLEEVATYYEDQIEEGASRLSSILDPVLMVIMISVVGTLLVSLYLPIFTMSNLLNSSI